MNSSYRTKQYCVSPESFHIYIPQDQNFHPTKSRSWTKFLNSNDKSLFYITIIIPENCSYSEVTIALFMYPSRHSSTHKLLTQDHLLKQTG